MNDDDNQPGLNPVVRRVFIPRNIPNRPDAMLEVADDGCRLFVRESPQISINAVGWEMLWEYKHFDIPGHLRPVLDALFASGIEASGRDRETGRDAKHESPVPERETPNHHPTSR